MHNSANFNTRAKATDFHYIIITVLISSFILGICLTILNPSFTATMIGLGFLNISHLCLLLLMTDMLFEKHPNLKCAINIFLITSTILGICLMALSTSSISTYLITAHTIVATILVKGLMIQETSFSPPIRPLTSPPVSPPIRPLTSPPVSPPIKTVYANQIHQISSTI
jgi:hypothetical protein